MLPMMIAGLVQTSVALKRMNTYMNRREIPTISSESNNSSNPSTNNDSAIKVENASFAWEKDAEKPTLSNVNLDIKKGSMVAVVGTVGSGKTSLVSSLLGELEKTKGNVQVSGKVAYVAQQAWIQNATLKYNILFGKAEDEDKYKKVLKDCALEPDLKILPAGDNTEIGEKGINLSGGQKQRVSLARACYSDTDIYLLDDPLSAVDSHVGKHIFDSVLGSEGCLGSKTRVLVTHGITYLPYMDNIVVLKEGEISETGTYKELLEKKGDFAEFLVQHLTEEEASDEVAELKNTLEETMGKENLERSLARARSVSESAGERSVSPASELNDSTTGLDRDQESPSKAYNRQKSHMSTVSSPKSEANVPNGRSQTPAKETEVKPNQSKQYQEEKSETGRVDWLVYMYYIRNMGFLLFGSCVTCYAIFQIGSASSSIWLSMWSDSNTAGAYNQTKPANYTEPTAERDMYLGVYGGLGIAQALSAVIGSLFLYLSTLQGSKRLHNNMLTNILKSPMSFFDTTPQGRIINRFSKDVDVLDSAMPMILRGWITCLLAVISTFVVITYTTPVFLAPIVVILCGYYVVQK